jgi:hypothetical protein
VIAAGILEAGQVEGHVEQDDDGAAHTDDEAGGLLELSVVLVNLRAREKKEQF